MACLPLLSIIKALDLISLHLPLFSLPSLSYISSLPFLCQAFSVAAAAAKSLQSCPTLCDPVDGSPPGSPVPGILQARTRSGLLCSPLGDLPGPGNGPMSAASPALAGKFFTASAIWEGQLSYVLYSFILNPFTFLRILLSPETCFLFSYPYSLQ